MLAVPRKHLLLDLPAVNTLTNLPWPKCPPMTISTSTASAEA